MYRYCVTIKIQTIEPDILKIVRKGTVPLPTHAQRCRQLPGHMQQLVSR